MRKIVRKKFISSSKTFPQLGFRGETANSVSVAQVRSIWLPNLSLVATKPITAHHGHGSPWFRESCCPLYAIEFSRRRQMSPHRVDIEMICYKSNPEAL